jgi:hypothetical protein
LRPNSFPARNAMHPLKLNSGRINRRIASQKEGIAVWLPPRDSNPDRLLQRQLSYH